MAKKKTSTKKTTKKTTTKKVAKKSPAKKSAAKKKKVGAKKKTTSKKSPTKTSKKHARKETTAKKTTAKKTTAKKPSPKKVAKKPAAKKTVTKKPASKKVSKRPTPKAPAKKTSASKPGSKTTDPKKPSGSDTSPSGRKGITIVDEKKKTRRSRPSAKARLVPRPPMPSLFGPNSRFKGPLIPSGPKNTVKTDGNLTETGQKKKKKKTPFKKRQLDKFREILLRKRAEVFGDLEELETGALRSGGSGGQSKLPQHDAEQGSDSADQNLSLNLAEADRNLIHEIDAALERIANKTYGLCSITELPISEERLEELPWAQHSIEAARRLERGHP